MASISTVSASSSAIRMLSRRLRAAARPKAVAHACINAHFVIQAVSRYKPEVCILDIVMPGNTGFGIVRELVAMNLARRPLLIALSGVFNKPSDEIVAKTAGFDLLVRKGDEPGELLRIIDELADEPPAA